MNDPGRNGGDLTSRVHRFVFVSVVSAWIAVGLAVLDLRIMHGDEANQAIRTAILVESGEYTYDPTEHHGPTLYYAGAAVARFFGQSDRSEMRELTLRAVPLLAGFSTLLLMWPMRHLTGTPAALLATLLLALSPGFAFYSRYYIQEVLLTCFSMSAIIFGARYFQTRMLRWTLLAGVCLGLMHATKETFVLAVGAAIIAGGATWVVFILPTEGGGGATTPRNLSLLHGACTLFAAAILSMGFFSSFGANPGGVLDSVATYGNYLQQAGGSDAHQHPWHFYLERLLWYRRGPGPVWSEGFIALAAAIGMVAAFVRRTNPGRAFGSEGAVRFTGFLGVYTLLLFLTYSAIGYKTTWNLLPFLVPMCVLGGIGLAVCLRALNSRVGRSAVAVTIVAGCGHLAYLNQQATTEYSASPYNPYVYGHTSSGLTKTLDLVEKLHAVHLTPDDFLIAVVQPDGDYWPLPWYFRGYKQVGYWVRVPESMPGADVFVVSPTLSEEFAGELGDGYTYHTTALRPGVLRATFVRRSLLERSVRLQSSP